MTALRTRLSKDSRAALGRRASRVRLFPAVTVALLAGLGVAFIAYGFLRWITPVDTSKTAAEIDVTRVALTVVAGVGGVVALVIAYRRQRDLEQGRFVERFGAAAAQLGATDVAVRIAGVYAMAGVADESDGLRRQQCIDVLCGYLRLPYSPELGGNHQTRHVQKRTVTGDTGENEDHFEYRQNDREVRATIVRVITDHLRPEAEYSWSTSNFDFRTAHLENVDFSRAVFSGAAHFEEATFTGGAGFNVVTFADDARFDEATFTGIASFARATFTDNAGFNVVTFADDARFDEATFTSIAAFGGATFTSDAEFGEATFTSNAEFAGATFSDAGFNRATFTDIADFGRAVFTGDAGFIETTFAGKAGFTETTFAGGCEFDRATFADDVSFAKVAFMNWATFRTTDFGSGRVAFTTPRRWGPPPPQFDWADDGHRKPSNIAPTEWPPAVAAVS
ncbi:pentapeptide repeat-containing protein [Nocardia sp. NPDC005998]|uniref:pentapeptide repeat-containing protein n=1 Tax=Nocardia sp. NPDC005998 TaxID=3156894 RepID=UPI0033B65919